MSVDEFLKRAGLWSKQRVFAEVTGICTVEGLVALNRSSTKATAKMLMKRFELEEEQVQCASIAHLLFSTPSVHSRINITSRQLI
jgi:hypothetical protein